MFVLGSALDGTCQIGSWYHFGRFVDLHDAHTEAFDGHPIELSQVPKLILRRQRVSVGKSLFTHVKRYISGHGRMMLLQYLHQGTPMVEVAVAQTECIYPIELDIEKPHVVQDTPAVHAVIEHEGARACARGGTDEIGEAMLGMDGCAASRSVSFAHRRIRPQAVSVIVGDDCDGHLLHFLKWLGCDVRHRFPLSLPSGFPSHFLLCVSCVIQNADQAPSAFPSRLDISYPNDLQRCILSLL